MSTREQKQRIELLQGTLDLLILRTLLLGRAHGHAIAKAIEGPITSSVSASALQMHPDVTFIIDEEAAYSLTQRDYYRHVLEMTQLFTPERLS